MIVTRVSFSSNSFVIRNRGHGAGIEVYSSPVCEVRSEGRIVASKRVDRRGNTGPDKSFDSILRNAAADLIACLQFSAVQLGFTRARDRPGERAAHEVFARRQRGSQRRHRAAGSRPPRTPSNANRPGYPRPQQRRGRDGAVVRRGWRCGVSRSLHRGIRGGSADASGATPTGISMCRRRSRWQNDSAWSR